MSEELKIAKEEERDSGNRSQDEAFARLVDPSFGYQSPASRSEIP